jgi:cell division protein DivIC
MSATRRRNVAKIQTELTHKHETELSYASLKRKRLIRRLTFFCLLVVVAAYFMISTLVSQAASLEKKEAEKERVQQELAELETKQEIFKEEIIKLNDDEYIAKLARRDYFLSEDNEIIFNIPEDTKAEQPTK